jgi:hypothetical protein
MEFKANRTLTLIALIGAFAATSAVADHNSVWGAGKANMPNDIHNTRIEEANTGLMTSEEWRDFVSKGAGAATVNRYLEVGETLPSRTSMSAGVDRPAQVTRGGRPDVASSVGMRAMNVSIDRPAGISRGGRR